MRSFYFSVDSGWRQPIRNRRETIHYTEPNWRPAVASRAAQRLARLPHLLLFPF